MDTSYRVFLVCANGLSAPWCEQVQAALRAPYLPALALSHSAFGNDLPQADLLLQLVSPREFEAAVQQLMAYRARTPACALLVAAQRLPSDAVTRFLQAGPRLHPTGNDEVKLNVVHATFYCADNKPRSLVLFDLVNRRTRISHDLEAARMQNEIDAANAHGRTPLPRHHRQAHPARQLHQRGRVGTGHRSVAHHNIDPKPFIWTACASDILAKVARAKAALAVTAR